MEIAISGHQGFIGSLLYDELSKEHNVYGIRTDIIHRYKFKGYKCDVIIHCARSDKNIMDKDCKLHESLDDEQWINEYKTDVMLPYEVTKSMFNFNLQHVIFISSIYGKKIPTIRRIPPNYITCKAAELQLMRYLAWELAPVQVNAVVLGGVKSDRPAADQHDDFIQKYNDKTLLGHMVYKEEVIGKVKFLISDQSKGMTGQEIVIDGGYTIL